jgi:transcriptional regulator with XRE-family HTH domain
MSAISTLRKQLGFSQDELARLAGVSRSAIALAESGRRKLPTAVLMRMGELSAQLQEKAVSLSDNDDAQLRDFRLEQQAKEQSELQHLITMREKLQAQLAKLQRQHAGACAALQLLERERLLFADIPTQLKRLDRMSEAAQADWRRSHPLHQRPMQIKLAELDARIATRQQLLNDYTPTENPLT